MIDKMSDDVSVVLIHPSAIESTLENPFQCGWKEIGLSPLTSSFSRERELYE